MTRYAKALIALLGAVATWGLTAAEDDRYTQVELWGALLAGVTALGVYAWPNKPPAGKHRRADVSEQSGHGDVGLLIFALLAIVVILAIVGVI